RELHPSIPESAVPGPDHPTRLPPRRQAQPPGRTVREYGNRVVGLAEPAVGFGCDYLDRRPGSQDINVQINWGIDSAANVAQSPAQGFTGPLIIGAFSADRNSVAEH